ncbi:MAG: carbon-nitrogen hydrolase family protein [Candidatus Cybelea sp.]|jgi:predicted amidohydrolase
MTRLIRAAAIQLEAQDRIDFARSLDGIVGATRRASAEADLVVLPEGTFPGYVLGDAPVDDDAIANALERLREIAISTQSVIVVGAALSSNAGIRNAAFVIDTNGSLAGRADKLFLWHFDRRWFTQGDRLAPIHTSIGTLGVLVCADGRIPTIARALVDQGAIALVMPTAWVTSGRDPDALENVQADLLARVRAYENHVPFIAANKCGSELGMVAYCGKSQIVDGDGEVIAIASEREPETLKGSVTLDGGGPLRIALPRLQPRLPHVERPLRLAISFDPLAQDVDDQLKVLDDAYAISPNDEARLALLDREVPVARVGDDLVLDPGGLVAYRRAGYPLICWTTSLSLPWSERFARARALELRIYLVVFDRHARRAYAVDPDGTVVAGTFDAYRLASFSLDLRKTTETTVAPRSDICEAIERVDAILEREKGAAT